MGIEDQKKAVWMLVQERKEELIGLCSDLLQIPSENPPGNVAAIVSYITAYLEKSGISFQIVGPDEDHPIVIAHIGDTAGNELVFNGHCDVVPAGDRSQWDFDPYSGEVTEKRIRGRGASDMKCGLGGALFIMRLLAEKNTKLKGTLTLHVVPDEESGGRLGTKWLVDQGFTQDTFACVVAEPTSSDNCEVGQKGSLQIRIKIKGKSAHGSLGKYKGDNAIRRMADLVTRLGVLEEMTGRYTEEQLPVLADSKRIAFTAQGGSPGVENIIDHVTVNLGTIKGGTKTNMVADYCEAEIDVRVPIGLPVQEVLHTFYSIVEEIGIPEIGYDINWNSEANYTDVNEPLIQKVVDNANAVWESSITPAYQWASSDARYYREAGIPTVQYGPANTVGIHSYNEDVDIEDVVNSAKVYAGVILDLIGCEE